MRTLAEDGWRLVRLGITTVEEVLSVTTAKEVARTTQDRVAGGRRQGTAPAAARRHQSQPLTCLCFNTKRCRPTAAMAEGQLEAAGPAGSVSADGRAGPAARSAWRKRPAPAAGTASRCRPRWLRCPFASDRTKVSGRALENFTRLLSSLLAAGVPLSRALVILYKEASSPAASAKWKEIHDLVIDGMSLADAMGKSPETFPRVYTAMVQAGETGGFLDLVLAQIADFQAREKELRSKVMTAMLYPTHPAGAGDGRAGLPADVLHSAVSGRSSQGSAPRCRC